MWYWIPLGLWMIGIFGWLEGWWQKLFYLLRIAYANQPRTNMDKLRHVKKLYDAGYYDDDK